MNKWLPRWFKRERFGTGEVDNSRRRVLGGLVAGSGLAALGSSQTAIAKAEEELRFPGDPAEHKLVYQFNKSDEETQKAILFSVGAMLRQWGDNVSIVVVAIGPGLHVLAKKPLRAVTDETRSRISSLNEYGVKFHACGNTMKALKWGKDDMLPFAEVVEVGASDLMELQEQGYAYISW